MSPSRRRMDASKMTFEISYKSLLARVVQPLNLMPPMYIKNEELQGVSSVLLKNKNSPTALMFQSVQKQSSIEAEESAAMTALTHLIKKYNLTVYDVNWEPTILYKDCAELYKSQIQHLRSLLEAPNTVDIGLTTPPTDSPSTLSVTVTMDFMQFLEHVANQLHIKLHSYETTHLSDGTCQTCLMLECDGFIRESEMHYVLSDKCKSPVDAMQNVAKKTLNYLQICYGFTVNDMNLEAMQAAWAQCYRRRMRLESLRVKLTEQNKGKAIVKSPEAHSRDWSPGPFGTITPPTHPPIPPKKRRFTDESTSCSGPASLFGFAADDIA